MEPPRCVPSLEFIEEEYKPLYLKICDDEENVEKELQNLLSRHCHLEAKVKNIVKILPNLELVNSDAVQLSEMIGFASNLAENVSYKVRKLDTARSRVSECQKRVHDLLDLQLCCAGVKSSMSTGDFEKAAAHVHRYLSMDQRLLEKTADDVNQDSATVNNSISVLQEAANKLRDILSTKFSEAIKAEDSASVERFFKLFPLLDMHDHGLEKYSNYLSSKIQVSSKNNLKMAHEIKPSDKRASVIYADVITLLFEDIARIIEIHQPLVESYYGPGHLLKVVKVLQEECDRQCKTIVNEMWRNRQMEKLITAVKDRNRSTAVNRPNPKDLDQLLGEITFTQSRYNLYCRFLRRKIAGDVTNGKVETRLKELDALLASSDVCRLMQDLLSNYLLFEYYFMEESVRKAISMDTVEPGAQTSSMIDDVFFIVKKCIRRASGTSNIDGVCTVINNACAVIETELCSTLLNSMGQGFPSGYLDLTQAYNVMIQGGRLQSSDSEQVKTTFIAYLNNTEVGSEYVDTLCSSLVSEVQCVTDLERNKLESCLAGLSSVSAAMGMAQELGLQQLGNIVIKPRITSWLDVFLSLSHNLTEEEFSSYEANEPFIRGLIGNINNLLAEFKQSLTPSNYESLVTLVATEVNSQLEKVIMKSEFNRLGGLALDKEVRGLISYLSTTTSWSVREKFTRLTQIATILNLERASEISDYLTSSHTWRLSLSDIKKIMKLRVDFTSDEIARIKL
ncbi:conserved oligomeric Golgi complex subunit 4 [Cimex lectularius]|uniref:Conserved oligomeric Golgi complex subunit 4 n=1 Tax=Cimex lectularius TaxID=79782 RepID=A0A8I6S8T3_CIMLE|nr:conserved oligomeric Golgi complex subunit 4 [Cimex lectularius]